MRIVGALQSCVRAAASTDIIARIEYKQGADGRYHSCVILTKR